MSKASKWAQSRPDTLRLSEDVYDWKEIAVYVTEKGGLMINADGLDKLQIWPKAALALGNWLVQIFGEENVAIQASRRTP